MFGVHVLVAAVCTLLCILGKQGLDFLVIGSHKAGTTALFEYLRRHPGLFLPAGKEVPFYSHDAAWDDGWALYAQRHFGLASDRQLWGTVSPQYMLGAPYRPLSVPPHPERVIPERIFAHSPNARLVAILRDPVERAYSHHQMQLLNGWESRPFAEAIRSSLEPEALAEARRSPVETNSYVSNGEYGRVLSSYYETFPREQLLVLFHHDLLERPEEVLRVVFRFLEVDDAFVPANIGKRYRVNAVRRRFGWVNPIAVQARLANVTLLRRAWHALPTMARARMDAGYKELSYRVDLANRVAASDAPTGVGDDLAAREQLRAHFAADAAVLRGLIGVELPW